MGTLATAYVAAGRTKDAVTTIERALSNVTPKLDEEARARLYHQAAYVFQYSDAERTERYAKLAVELALAHGLFGLAARAYSAVYSVRYQADDVEGSVAALRQLDECARKAADSQARLFGLMASYELAVERADNDALEAIDAELHGISSTFTYARSEALLPALAIRATWDGDFARAYEMARESIPQQSSGDRRALCWSEIAFYALASGRHDDGEPAIANAVRELESVARPALRATRSLTFLALAELVRGHDAASHRYLTEAEASAKQFPRARAFAHAVRVLHRIHLRQADESALQAEIEHLRQVGFAGMAHLLAALPAPHTTGEGYVQLTPAEREILQFLANGASTKDIAARTARSPHTVDTHIRAICRKLNCSGRREAVALAVGAGWVHA
jgi:DNA-binding CsgD family transcriptional regulator